MEVSLNKNFEEMTQNEMMDIDGGVAWALVGLGVFCAACFGMGVYNGYKGNS